MEEDVRQRIISVIIDNKISINSLSKGNKALQRKLNRQINEGASITVETISSILENIPSISAEWLLTGKGNMKKSESSDLDIIENLKEENISLRAENKLLRELNGLGERRDIKEKSAS